MENEVPQVYLLGKTYLINNEKFYIRNDSIIHMAAGDRHVIIVTEKGRVYAFGDNNAGQLGLGHTKPIEKVSCIKSLKFSGTEEKVILAACGQESSIVATNQGSLYVFGSNHRCQLGIESGAIKNIQPYPVKIEYFQSNMSWKQLSMGAEHTCVLTNDGQVYVWGSNEYGQCGLELKRNSIKTAQELKLSYSITNISCGYYHTALISQDGRLFVFGNNLSRQLGCTVPNEYIGPFEVSFSDRIKSVACGNQHTILLTDKGEVYACGKGDRGQLGLGHRISFVKQFEIIENLPKHVTTIATGEAHTAVIDADGHIYLFGDGKHGKLNSETESDELKLCFIEKFKGYNVLKVVCGGCQTIILAQKKSTENNENTNDTTILQNKSNEILVDHTNSNNASPTIKYSPIHCVSDEISTSTKSPLINKKHLQVNRKFQSKNSSLELDYDLTKSNNSLFSNEKPSPRYTRKIRNKCNSDDDEISSAKERLLPICDQNNQIDSLTEASHRHHPFRTISSSTSGRSSSFVSSVNDEDATLTSEPEYDFQTDSNLLTTKIVASSYLIDPDIDLAKPSIATTTTTPVQIGLFSKILNTKTTNKKSKSCTIL